MKARPRYAPVAAFALVVVLAWVSVGTLLQYGLAKFTHNIATELVPDRYELHPPTFPFRSIDLGYLKLALPAAFDGDPHIVQESRCIEVSNTHEEASVVFFPPMQVDDKSANDYRGLLDQFALLTGRPMPTFFDLNQTALETMPFDLWDIPQLGPKETKTRLALLAMKQLLIVTSTDVRIFETTDLGAIISNDRSNTAQIAVFDRRRGTMQAVLIKAEADLTEQIFLTVLATYQLTTDDFSPASIDGLLNAASVTTANASSND